MKLKTIEVKNYRLLKDFIIDLEDDLSLVIGKNNTGKTSFLNILQKFLCTSSNSFHFDDFCIGLQKDIKQTVESSTEFDRENFKSIKLELGLYIEYSDSDSLENLAELILDLDPVNKILLLSFEYVLDFDGYKKLRHDFSSHHSDDFFEFTRKYHKDYFKIKRWVIDSNDENNRIEIESPTVSKIINLQSISAKREVVNEDIEKAKSNKTLSRLSYKYYTELI